MEVGRLACSMVTLRRDCNRAASFASLLYAIGEAMWRGHGLLPIVVEEEKHGSERMHACVPFLGSSRERLPLAGSPVTLSPNRTYEFPGIRLSLYVSLKMFSIR